MIKTTALQFKFVMNRPPDYILECFYTNRHKNPN